MAKKKERTTAQQVADYLDEYGLKEDVKQAAADILKEGIRMTREAILNQGTLPQGRCPECGNSHPASFCPNWEPIPESDDPVNPFVLLGVREDAPFEVVRAAFRAMVKIVHPDVDGGTEEGFQLIHEAFDWIKEKRGWA